MTCATLDGLDLDTIDDVVAEVAVDERLDPILREAGCPDAVAEALATDVATLLRRHAALSDGDRLAIRLEVIETDACRRFPAACVTLRLLCIYVGPGTEWHCIDVPLRSSVPAGAVTVFKGHLSLDPPTLLHCSPAIATTGERRVMLTIDPARTADLCDASSPASV